MRSNLGRWPDAAGFGGARDDEPGGTPSAHGSGYDTRSSVFQELVATVAGRKFAPFRGPTLPDLHCRTTGIEALNPLSLQGRGKGRASGRG